MVCRSRRSPVNIKRPRPELVVVHAFNGSSCYFESLKFLFWHVLAMQRAAQQLRHLSQRGRLLDEAFGVGQR